MKIHFDARLYTLKAVNAAIEAYRGLARIDAHEREGQIVVTLESVGQGVDELAMSGEFSNFVLAEMA